MDSKIKILYLLSLLCGAKFNILSNDIIINEILYRYSYIMDMPKDSIIDFINKFMIMEE